MWAKNFFSSSIASALDLVIKSIISFGISIYIARQFGLENFAIFTLAMSAQAILSQFIKFGIGPIFLREMCSEKRASVMNSYYSVLINNSICMLFVLLFCYYFFELTERYVIIFIIAVRALWISDILFKNLYYSMQKIEIFHLISIISSLIFLSIILVCVYFEVNFTAFSVILIIDVLIFYLLFKSQNTGLNLSYTNQVFEAYKYCFPLLITDLCIVLYLNLDRWMLFYLIDEIEVAQYGTAYKVNSIMFQLIPIVIGVVTPVIFAKRKDNSNLDHEKSTIGPFIFALSIVATFLMYLLGPVIILVFYGDEFYPAAEISKVLCFMILLGFWGSFQGIYLIRDDNLSLYLKLNLITLVLNVGFNFILIPEYGAVGSVYATLISGMLAYSYALFVKSECLELFRSYINLRSFVR